MRTNSQNKKYQWPKTSPVIRVKQQRFTIFNIRFLKTKRSDKTIDWNQRKGTLIHSGSDVNQSNPSRGQFGNLY